MKFAAFKVLALFAAVIPALATPHTSAEHANATTVEKRQQYYYGTATYYYPDGAPGACGIQYTSESQVVALPESLYDGGAHCGQYITIWANDNPSSSQGAIVGDLCPGCQGTYGIDLSPELFQLLAPLADGVVAVSYFFQ